MGGVSVFALIAVLCFVLALFRVNLAGLDLTILGLVFVALHLAVGGLVWGPRRPV